MNKTALLFLFILIRLVGFSQDPEKLYDIARSYLKSGDYANAEMLLTKLYEKDTLNADIRRDLSYCYYYENDFKKALNLVSPVIASDTADEKDYVLASDIYEVLIQPMEQEKILRTGVKKFPESGRLNNRLGNLLYKQKNKSAVTFWENGIKNDPFFAKNYFDAALYYNDIDEKMWSVLYGEIYLNMDPLNPRNAELKEILLGNYKEILADILKGGNQKEKNDFVKKITRNFRKQNIPNEINAASLMPIRTKFIISWFNDNPEKTPFYLFEFQREMLQEGIYEAYNQWLFGSSENLLQFHKWAKAHEKEYETFISFQKTFSRFLPKDQYYH